MKPWESGSLPSTAQQARDWIVSGWEPSADDMRRLGPQGAAALGLEYVEVKPNWPRILMWVAGLLLIGAVFFRGGKVDS